MPCKCTSKCAHDLSPTSKRKYAPRLVVVLPVKVYFAPEPNVNTLYDCCSTVQGLQGQMQKMKSYLHVQVQVCPYGCSAESDAGSGQVRSEHGVLFGLAGQLCHTFALPIHPREVCSMACVFVPSPAWQAHAGLPHCLGGCMLNDAVQQGL